MKELRNCKTDNKYKRGKDSILPPANLPNYIRDITSCQIRKSLLAVSKQWSLSGLSKEEGKKQGRKYRWI